MALRTARRAGRPPVRPGPRRDGAGAAVPTLMWLRAPFLLWRFPAVAVAIAGAALVLGLSAGSSRLFVSSAGTAAFTEAVRGTSAGFAGLTARFSGPISSDRLDYRLSLLQGATGGVPHIGTPVISAVDDSLLIGAAPFTHPPLVQVMRFATKTNFVDHIHRLEGGAGPGWWVPEKVARRDHIHAGDDIRVAPVSLTVGKGYFQAGPEIHIHVAGVYRDLYRERLSSYWTAEYDLIGPENDPPPPPFLLNDPHAMLRLEDRLGGSGTTIYEVPVYGGHVTLDGASAIAQGLERAQAQMDDPNSQLSASFAEHDSGLPALVRGARATVSSITGPVDVVAAAGVVVALAVFVAAGAYGLERRRIELSMLQARGVGPGTLGVKAGLEALLPGILGAALGWWAALALVRSVGPSETVSVGAIRGSVTETVVVLSGGLVLLGAAMGFALRARRESRFGRFRRLIGKLPWEAVVLALAAASFYEIEAHGAAPVEAAGGAQKIDILIPLFPILFVAGLGGLAARAVRRSLPRLRESARRTPSPVYMAAHRLASASRLALWLLTASILAVGVVAYAGVFVTSVTATSVEKAQVSIGSDASIILPEPNPPDRLGAPTTEVLRLPAAEASPGTSVGVIAVDPATFSRAAFWDPSFSSQPLQGLLDTLSSGGSSLPVLVAGGSLPSHFDLQFFGDSIPAHVVAVASGFPGMTQGSPLVVVSAKAFEAATEAAHLTLQDLTPTYELWVAGDPAPVVRALERARLYPTAVTTASRVERSPGYLGLSWLFGFLEALGILAGLLALIALLLYVESRQRTREVSYALAARMGLSRRAHMLSVTLELGTMLAVAFVVGTGLAAAAAFMVRHRVDPLPQIPPPALYRVPVTLIGLVAASLAVFAVIAAWAVQRRADRTNVAELMRLAG